MISQHTIKSFKVRPILLALCLTLILTQGCIKYTPSREELESRLNGGEQRDALRLGTEEEFNEYERKLSERLNTLVSERAYLLEVGGSNGTYAIGPGDVVQVDVYGFSDLSSEAEVSSNGSLSLPLIGDINTKGRDLSDLKRLVTSRYATYVKNPRVDLAIKNYQSNRVSVIGEVQRPGMYPLKRNGQLLTELLSEAGGKNQVASNRLILLPAPKLRDHQLQNTTINYTPPNSAGVSGVEVEMEALLGKIDQRPLLIPLVAGDTVVVPEAGNYEVDGEVQKPGSFTLTSGTSVIGAIAAAGGFTYSADVRKVEVIRDIGAGRKALATLNLEEVGLRGARDIRLRAGDLVRVPSEPGRFFERQVVETLNALFNGVSVNKRTN